MTDKRPWPTRPMFVDENPNKRDGADVGRYVIVIDDSMQRYAAYTTTGVQEHEEEAIARLFAAAPELYDALCLVASDLEVLMQIKDNEVIRKIQAALLKADPNVLEARHDG